MIRAAIQRPVTVSMVVIAILLFGLVSLQRLPLNLLPDISYPSLTIQADYEDSAPEEVENLITRLVEEAVGVLPGLTRMSSISRAGQSEVVLEFAWGTNMDLAALEAREKLDLVTLPRDAKRPVLLRFDPSNDPILRIRLSGTLGLSRLRYAADHDLRKHIESVDGVAAVKVAGGLEEQIQIEIDEKRLAELRIPIAEVVQILGQENLNQASGSLYNEDSNYLVRIVNQFQTVDEIGRIIIRDQDGRKVVLQDVARVWRGAKEREVITRLNGQESVELAVYKEGDANTVNVADRVSTLLAGLKKTDKLPSGTDYQIVSNQAEFIQQSIDDVLSSAMVGALLAIAVLFLFLRDLRSTVTIALTTPIAIMATFALMYQMGVTLNLMSLGGIALGVGMLVDNSIVVLEAVDRHKATGVRLSEAVYQGTREVSMAVTASTLTTIAVFLPLIFVEGISGQLFKDQAMTITFSQVASLLVGLTLIPMVLALRLNKPPEIAAAAREQQEEAPLSDKTWLRAIQRVHRGGARSARNVSQFVLRDLVVTVVGDVRRLFRWIGSVLSRGGAPLLDWVSRSIERVQTWYTSTLRWSLNHKLAVFVITGALTGGALLMVPSIGAELIPAVTQGEFYFEVKLQDGTPLARTDALLKQVESEATKYAGVKTVFSSIGGSNKNQFARSVVEEHVGQIYIVMADKQDKQAEQNAIERLRSRLAEFPDAAITFQRPTFLNVKTPVEVEIYGFDLEALRQTADSVQQRLSKIPGLYDLQTSTRLGNPEVQIRFDRQKLTRLGLDEGRVASLVRSKIRGDVASRFREEDKQIEMLVRASRTDRNTIVDIQNLIINSGSTGPGAGLGSNSSDATQQASGGSGQAANLTEPTSAIRAPFDAAQNAPEAAGGRQTGSTFVPIRLSTVAAVEVGRGPSEVRRIRSQRAAVVSGSLSGRDLGSVTDDIRNELSKLRPELSPNVTVGIGGQNEEMQRSRRSLELALGLAIFLVYLVMASEFESLTHPLIILCSIPLGLVGVVYALFLTNTPFSVVVFLGVIILAGIVVNNAIVLIDYTNQLRVRGMGVRQALEEAGATRLRPILMTTLTTVLGLVPMAFSWGEGAEIRAPMAVTVMGGMVLSTALTLLFIPVVYESVTGRRKAAPLETGYPSFNAGVHERPSGD